MTDRCVHVRAGDAERGQTGVTYAAGISAATAGARGLSLQIASLPPGARAWNDAGWGTGGADEVGRVLVLGSILTRTLL
jgi:uncharacterized RmlC-like cupin family protein